MIFEAVVLGGVVAGLWRDRAKPGERRARALRRRARALGLPTPSPQALVVANRSAEDPLRALDRRVAVEAGALGMIATGTFAFPPLMAVGLGVHFGTMAPAIARDLHQSLIVERRVGLVSLDVILISLMMGLGQFLASAIGCTLYLISRRLVLTTEDRSKQALAGLFDARTATVWLQRDGVEVETPIEAVRAGDVVVANAGDVVPVDGTVAAGAAALDQRALTGEAQPADLEVGCKVFAGTVVLSGRLEIAVTASGEETVGAKLREILLRTADIKSAMHSKGEQIADATAVPTIAVGGVATAVGMPAPQVLALMNANFGYNMRVLAPVGMLRHLAQASRAGVLVKDGRALDLLTEVDTVVFDKTGTLTEDVPTVAGVHPFGGWREDELLRLAAAAEQTQTHPIARAIKAAAAAKGFPPAAVEDAAYAVGFGLEATVEGHRVRVGSRRFMEVSGVEIPDDASRLGEALAGTGASTVAMAVDGRLAALFEVVATVRPEAHAMVARLRARGVAHVCIISGDQEAPTRALAEALGMDEHFAEVPPEGKAALVERLQSEGRTVLFVGDGINDSIALRQAHVSVSLAGASTIATDTAAIVMMDGDLAKLPAVFDIARSVEETMSHGFYTSMIPGFAALGGVLFLHVGIVGTMLINQAGLVAGLSGAAFSESATVRRKRAQARGRSSAARKVPRRTAFGRHPAALPPAPPAVPHPRRRIDDATA